MTGHRGLRDDAALRERVREQLAALTRGATNARVTVMTALAEGADRLVAREALAYFAPADLRLEAVLPLPVGDYLLDFQTSASKWEFEALLARADRIVEVAPAATRAEAYERAGRYVVDHSDALIALWDGLAGTGRGGTADIVAYARAKDTVVVVIPVTRLR